MSSIAPESQTRKVIIGVDTHKHIHVGVAIDQHGARLGDLSVGADSWGASTGSASKEPEATGPG
jgi:hypothetical protein